MFPKTLMTLVIFSLLLSGVGCNTPEGQELLQNAGWLGPEAATLSNFVAWANRVGTPYKDPLAKVLKNDQTFATVRVTAKFRDNPQSDWVEMWTDVDVKNVGGQWQAPVYFSFRVGPTPVPK